MTVLKVLGSSVSIVQWGPSPHIGTGDVVSTPPLLGEQQRGLLYEAQGLGSYSFMQRKLRKTLPFGGVDKKACHPPKALS